ncbi:MAG: FliA/WhiG family RNA polymerase sigma factor [Gammaproteobacteria bacterium]
MQSVSVYEENADGLVLEQFVLEHRPLVKKIALYIKRRLPSHVEFDDLLQSGLVGLLEARSQYKQGMGASFETYASIRIRGAIIDSLRKNSWVTRETIKNMRKISAAISLIEQRDQKQATTEEIAAELGISMEEHFKISQEISVCNVMSLDEIDHDYSIIGDDSGNPQTLTQSDSMKEQLKKVLTYLPEREQLVLSLYYVDEFTFKQIGEILELTEARICQLHSQAIARIRSKMKGEIEG